jgi:hypothetical protein
MQNYFLKPSVYLMVVFLVTLGSCGGDDDDNCKPASIAVAGDDQLVAGTSTTLEASTPDTGTGTWSIKSGAGGSLGNAADPETTFTGTAGTSYTLLWTVSGCPESSDEVVITFENDPVLLSIDDETVVNGSIITVTGVNFSSNYQGNSQLITRSASTSDVYLPIISRTATTIKAVVVGPNGGSPGTFDLVYWKRETSAPGEEFPSEKHITIAAPGASDFKIAPSLSTSNANEGDEITAGVKNGGATLADYSVTLIYYDYETGASQEFAATVNSFTADGFPGGTMDALEFTVPSSIPSGEYSVLINNKGTKLITGWNQSFSVN